MTIRSTRAAAVTLYSFLLVTLAATQVACMARARTPSDGGAVDAAPGRRDAPAARDRGSAGLGGKTGARPDAGHEICDNGLDDDGDGQVDDGCSCLLGGSEPCLPFAAGLAGVGACRPGVAACVPGDEVDTWGACVGAQGPAAEICDGVDNDCDGVVDNGCACLPGEQRSCYPGPVATAGVGACHAGTQVCVVEAGVARFADCAGAVVPAGAETCNGIDDDCNGVTDDGLVRSCGSGVGDCRPGMQACAAGTWGACAGGVGPTTEDCNGGDENCDGTVDEGCTCVDGARIPCGRDTGACVAGTQLCVGGRYAACTGAVNPVTETCNGVDDDCDGVVDNGCACLNGDTRACYAGPAGTAGVGICRAGTQKCVVAAGVAAWAACTGQVLPAVETCNNLDDNCDGRVDEALTRSCGSSVGDCRAGTQTCAAGVFGACVGGVGPTTEDCNGGDENCDGVVDEGCSCVDGTRIPCGTDTGLCVAGTQLCVGGKFSACTGAVGPVTETCNDIDDDCDGTIDNGCVCRRGDTRACYDGPAGTAGVGICRAGAQACAIDAGVARWGVCAGQVLPGAESCNALDDDCDGTADDGVTRSCGSSVGDCRPGTQICVAGVFGACVGGVGATTEDCNGGDENCNGVVDEGCSCVDGARIACGTDTGACVAGAQTCVGGKFGSCVGSVGPVLETCNGVDDDCDGIVDNGCLCQRGDTRACYDGPAGTAGVGACRAGTQACVIASGLASWGSCTGQALPTAEICNNLDDDCDGHVDDAVTRACGSNVGDCRPGVQTCVAGVFGACAGGVTATTEDCNGGDENCDGVVDEGCTCLDGTRIPCGTDTGACVAGTQTCAGGKFAACAGAVGPVTETCNDIDDDCDGTIDNGCVCRRGQTRGCYDGPAGTAGVGICRAGAQTCVITAGVAAWGLCAGQVLPGAESCNALDDDCDGAVDDGVTRACGSSVGDCRPGTQTCAAGVFGACVGGVAATTEDCNGGDENCNGVVDEGCSCVDGTRIACGTDTGACVAGTQTCVGGKFAACTGAVGPAAETCNGADDDCDGVGDNGFACVRGAAQTCTTACQTAGTRTCGASCTFGPCLATEACNGCDDDGDGVIDDGFTCPRGAVQTCTTACQTLGTHTCNGTCSGFSTCIAAAEICGNRCDDDGNGTADDGCCAAGAWTLTVIDAMGQHHPDIALDGAGGVHVVYGDFPSQAAYRHLLADGTQQFEIIDQSAGTLPMMAVDAAGVVHAAFDDDLAGHHILRYSRKGTQPLTWNAEAATSATDGDKTMVVDPTGAVHIVFVDRWGGGSAMHYLRRAPAGGWTDSVLAAGASQGVSLTVDSAGLVHLVYHDLSLRQLRHGVRSAAGVWTFDAIESINEAVFAASIKIDARGRIHVAAMRAVISSTETGRFRYYLRDGTTWSAEDIATGMWIPGQSDPSGGVPGEGSSLALDPTGTPYVAYYLVGSGDLRFAHRTGPGTWQSELIDASAGPLDGVTGSIRAAIAVDANLVVHVVFSRFDEIQLVHGVRRCK